MVRCFNPPQSWSMALGGQPQFVRWSSGCYNFFFYHPTICSSFIHLYLFKNHSLLGSIYKPIMVIFITKCENWSTTWIFTPRIQCAGARATALQCSTWLRRTRRGVALGQVPAHRTDWNKGPAAAGGGGLTSGDFMRQNRGIIVV